MVPLENLRANIVVTPADALVINTDEFRRAIAKALLMTDQSKAIVTIGIKPVSYTHLDVYKRQEGKFLPGIALGANDPIADKGANTFQSYYGVITKKIDLNPPMCWNFANVFCWTEK